MPAFAPENRIQFALPPPDVCGLVQWECFVGDGADAIWPYLCQPLGTDDPNNVLRFAAHEGQGLVPGSVPGLKKFRLSCTKLTGRTADGILDKLRKLEHKSSAILTSLCGGSLTALRKALLAVAHGGSVDPRLQATIMLHPSAAREFFRTSMSLDELDVSWFRLDGVVSVLWVEGAHCPEVTRVAVRVLKAVYAHTINPPARLPIRLAAKDAALDGALDLYAGPCGAEPEGLRVFVDVVRAARPILLDIGTDASACTRVRQLLSAYAERPLTVVARRTHFSAAVQTALGAAGVQFTESFADAPVDPLPNALCAVLGVERFTVSDLVDLARCMCREHTVVIVVSLAALQPCHVLRPGKLQRRDFLDYVEAPCAPAPPTGPASAPFKLRHLFYGAPPFTSLTVPADAPDFVQAQAQLASAYLPLRAPDTTTACATALMCALSGPRVYLQRPPQWETAAEATSSPSSEADDEA